MENQWLATNFSDEHLSLTCGYSHLYAYKVIRSQYLPYLWSPQVALCECTFNRIGVRSIKNVGHIIFCCLPVCGFYNLKCRLLFFSSLTSYARIKKYDEKLWHQIYEKHPPHIVLRRCLNQDPETYYKPYTITKLSIKDEEVGILTLQ